MNTKEAVRRACKSQRAALSVADCNTWTSMLTEQIVNTPEYKSANSIMALFGDAQGGQFRRCDSSCFRTW